MNIYFALLNMENWPGMATGEKVSVVWIAFVILMVIVAAIGYSRNPANPAGNEHNDRHESQGGKEHGIRIEAFIQKAVSLPGIDPRNAQEEEEVCRADLVNDTCPGPRFFDSADAIKPDTRKAFRHDGATGGHHATGEQVSGKRVTCIIKKLGEGHRENNHKGLYEILLTIRQSLSSE